MNYRFSRSRTTMDDIASDVRARFQQIVDSEVSVAARHIRCGGYLDRDDLRQDAWAAVIHALRTYDEERNVPIEAHVRLRVRYALKEVGKRADPLSESVRRDLRQQQAETLHLQHDSGVQRTAKQLERVQRVTEKRKRELVRQYVAASGTESEETLHLQEQSLFPDPEQWVISTEQRIDLYRALKTLSARQRTIIEMRYFEYRTVTDIAVALSISPGRVSQIATAAVAHLRTVLHHWGEARSA